MSFRQTVRTMSQTELLKLINKILLFQYSREFFSAKKRGVALKFIQNTQLITFFLTISAYYPLFNVLTILLQIVFIAEIYTHEY